MLFKEKIRLIKWGVSLLFFVILLLFGPFLVLVSCSVKLNTPWYSASRASAELAPAPQFTPEAVVQVYAARAVRWRGLFSVHMWIAVKPENASRYRIYQVLGWRAYRGRSVVATSTDIPDRFWYGSKPKLFADLRGQAAAKVIPQIEEAVASYPYFNQYRIWPGPNSNTFIAHVAREVPALELVMPANAIGKDYLQGTLFAKTPSGTGYLFSLLGLLGASIGFKEGIEVNILGLTYGFDFLGPALKLPGIGRIGWGPHLNFCIRA